MSDAAPQLMPRALLRQMFDAAIASAQPALCIPPHLPDPPRGRLIVVGAGKASAAMARAVEENWPGPLSGLVITRYGYAVPCDRIEVVEAAHPVPDAAGMHAAQRMLELVSSLHADDLVPFSAHAVGQDAYLALKIDGGKLGRAVIIVLEHQLLGVGEPPRRRGVAVERGRERVRMAAVAVHDVKLGCLIA